MYIRRNYSRRNEFVSRGEESTIMPGGNAKTFFKHSIG
jgi:hypothetical protein